MTTSQGSKRVAIAGGGLGGLACAKSLVDAGHQVHLIESAPFLGGRASTHKDATIRLNTILESIDMNDAGDGVRAFHCDGQSFDAEVFVCALPVWLLGKVLPEVVRRQPFFESLRSMPTCPAISLWFDRPVIGNAAFTLVAHSPGSVYQDQSTTAYPDARGSRVSVSVAPAEKLMDMPDEELIDRLLSDIGKLHPSVRRTFLHKALVLRHPQHLVQPLPGVMASRPANATPIGNLYLAGDRTNQPFFGSQEGAVRSGRLCAERS